MIAIKIPYASTEITRFSKLNKNFVNNGIRQIPKCANKSIDNIEKEIRFERPKNCERSNQKFAITTKLCANKKISFANYHIPSIDVGVLISNTKTVIAMAIIASLNASNFPFIKTPRFHSDILGYVLLKSNDNNCYESFILQLFLIP